MTRYQNLPVFKDTYDLFLRVYVVCRTLNRDYKYTIGEDLKKKLMDVLLGVYRINKNEPDRKGCFRSCVLLIEEVKLLFRLLHDLNQITAKQYCILAERAENVSRQFVLWEKYLAKGEKPDK